MVTLNVEFLLDDDFVKHSEAVTKAVGKSPSSSGAGFGVRDMQFELETRAKAREAKGKIDQLNIPELNSWID